MIRTATVPGVEACLRRPGLLVLAAASAEQTRRTVAEVLADEAYAALPAGERAARLARELEKDSPDVVVAVLDEPDDAEGEAEEAAEVAIEACGRGVVFRQGAPTRRSLRMSLHELTAVWLGLSLPPSREPAAGWSLTDGLVPASGAWIVAAAADGALPARGAVRLGKHTSPESTAPLADVLAAAGVASSAGGAGEVETDGAQPEELSQGAGNATPDPADDADTVSSVAADDGARTRSGQSHDDTDEIPLIDVTGPRPDASVFQEDEAQADEPGSQGEPSGDAGEAAAPQSAPEPTAGQDSSPQPAPRPVPGLPFGHPRAPHGETPAVSRPHLPPAPGHPSAPKAWETVQLILPPKGGEPQGVPTAEQPAVDDAGEPRDDVRTPSPPPPSGPPTQVGPLEEEPEPGADESAPRIRLGKQRSDRDQPAPPTDPEELLATHVAPAVQPVPPPQDRAPQRSPEQEHLLETNVRAPRIPPPPPGFPPSQGGPAQSQHGQPPQNGQGAPPQGVVLADLAGAPASRPPLPVAGQAPPQQQRAIPQAIVPGVNCPAGHFNHPQAVYCHGCGRAMVQQTRVLTEGPRPSLGFMVVDDGQTYPLDRDLLVGRKPGGNPEQAVVLRGDTSTVSREHTRIELRGWDVVVTDLGSTNGTWLRELGSPGWFKLAPGAPAIVRPGTEVAFGDRQARLEITLYA